MRLVSRAGVRDSKPIFMCFCARLGGSQEAVQRLHVDLSSLHAASATFDIIPSIEDGSLATRVIERELVWRGRLARLGLTLHGGHRATVCAAFDNLLKQVTQFLASWFSRQAETPRRRLDQDIEAQTQAWRLMADATRA